MNIVVFSPLPCVSKRTRLFKIFEFTKSLGGVLHFYGWERVVSESTDFMFDESYIRKIILRGGGYSNVKVRLMYVLWFVSVFMKALKLRKSDKVWALGFESALPAIIASKIKGFSVVYDDADRFSSLFNFPHIVNIVLVKLERWCSKNSSLHVIPGIERYDFESSNFYVIKNTPSEGDLIKAKGYQIPNKIKLFAVNFDKIIYVNGWLGDGRGMKQIYDLAIKDNSKHLGFIVAGRIDCAFAEKLIKLPSVIYVGELPAYQSLAMYKLSSYVFTYYDPVIPINIYAEANKWGDAIRFGTPVIVNSEVITAQYLRSVGGAVSVRYSDVNALYEAIRFDISEYEEYSNRKEGMAVLHDRFGSFDSQLEGAFKITEWI